MPATPIGDNSRRAGAKRSNGGLAAVNFIAETLPGDGYDRVTAGMTVDD
jgi:hypothetical protein